MVGSAGQAGLLAVVVEREPELGGDHHLVTDRRQCLPDELFVDERSVDLGGVEERDAPLDRGADQGDGVLAIGERAVALAHAHAAEAERRDLEVGAECSRLHPLGLMGQRLRLRCRSGQGFTTRITRSVGPKRYGLAQCSHAPVELGVVMQANVLWIIAVVIAVVGVIVLISGSVVWGIILLVIAALVGPGGYSIFNRRR